MREKWIEPLLEAARKEGSERRTYCYPEAGGIVRAGSKTLLNFSSNDYLNLLRHPHVVERSRKALEQYGAGSGSSRLVTGTLSLHEELEERLAKRKGFPAALLFGSGWLANLGIVPVLAGRGDLIFADKLAHASLIDACKISGARLVRFAHNNPGSLEKRLQQHADSRSRRLVITESVFSMDGDLAPLREIAALAEKYTAMLLVDEAHAIGTFGPRGCGLLRELQLEGRVTVCMGTMSKALAGYGGFAACSEKLRNLLVQSARTFIYTTAPPPALLGAALGALDVLEASAQLGKILQDRAEEFRRLLHKGGINTMKSQSQIVPVLIGRNKTALAVSQWLRERDIIATAIRPPTVPPGSARLRLSLTLAHRPADLECAAKHLVEVMQKI